MDGTLKRIAAGRRMGYASLRAGRIADTIPKNPAQTRDGFEVTSSAIWCSAGIHRAPRRPRRYVAREGGPGREGFALRRAKLLYSRDSKWK